MKQDLPRFMMLSTQFIDPLYQSFYYMQSVSFHISYPIILNNELTLLKD